MKDAPTQLAAHLKQEVSTLCTCWRLTRVDGTIYTWTDHDDDLTIGEEIYMSAAEGGFDRTALESSAGLDVSDLELIGFLGKCIKREELTAGLFDGAELEVFVTSWENPEYGGLELRRGFLGEVTMASNNLFRVELRGIQSAFHQVVGENYSPECRANFCDERCKLQLENYTYEASVTEVTNRRVFRVDVEPDIYAGAWHWGVVRFTSGLNMGRPMEVKNVEGAGIELKFAMPNLLAVGDTLSVSAGCDQRLSTCRDYGNVVNFRGEPYVPGDSVIYKMHGSE